MGSFMKFIQVTLAVACMILHYNTMYLETDVRMNIVITGTFFGYAIICGVLLIGELFQKPSEKFVDAVFCVVGCILFAIVGLFIIGDWHGGINDKLQTESFKQATAKGALAIVNAVLLLLDVWC